MSRRTKIKLLQAEARARMGGFTNVKSGVSECRTYYYIRGVNPEIGRIVRISQVPIPHYDKFTE